MFRFSLKHFSVAAEEEREIGYFVQAATKEKV